MEASSFDPKSDLYGRKRGPDTEPPWPGFLFFLAISDGVRQNFFHGFRRLFPHCRCDAGIGVQSGPAFGMVQHPGYRLMSASFLQRQYSGCGPQVMRYRFKQSCPLQHLIEHVWDAVPGDGPRSEARPLSLSHFWPLGELL